MLEVKQVVIQYYKHFSEINETLTLNVLSTYKVKERFGRIARSTIVTVLAFIKSLVHWSVVSFAGRNLL